MNFYGHGGEEFCDEVGEFFFDASRKEEIAEIMGTHEDEKFVAEKEISHVVEQESEVFGDMENVTKDCDKREIFYFIVVDEFFEAKDAIVKIDAIVSVKKLKEKYGDVKNIGGGNYDFLVLGNFLGDVE